MLQSCRGNPGCGLENTYEALSASERVVIATRLRGRYGRWLKGMEKFRDE